MPPLRDTRTTLSTFTPDSVNALDGPEWLRARRAGALRQFASLPLPTSDEEEWRYSRIDDLDLARFATPAPRPASGTPLEPSLQDVLTAVPDRAATVVVRNGYVATVELAEEWAAKGVRIGPVAVAADLEGAPAVIDALGHLHDALVGEPLVIDVPDGVMIEAPVVVLHHLDGADAASAPHTIVRAGVSAQVTVVEYHGSADVAALTLPVVELHAGDAANLRYLDVQDLGASVWQVGAQRLTVGRDANLLSSVVALGGDYARLRTVAELTGLAGTADLAAVYFGDGRQMHDFRTVQDHVAPRTTSHLLFKGAVEDAAHGVYTGLIRVQRGATQADAYLANRNLVLSDGSRVDSVPNLEIVNENDIKHCGHASATGPVDEDQRFYLESRGIPTDVAERLIVLGFFDDVIARTPLPGLRPLLRHAVALKLDKALAGIGA